MSTDKTSAAPRRGKTKASRNVFVRDIPDDLWIRVKGRAAKEGRTLRWIIIALLKRYADRGLD